MGEAPEALIRAALERATKRAYAAPDVPDSSVLGGAMRNFEVEEVSVVVAYLLAAKDAEIAGLRSAIADIDAHATPVGLLDNDDPDGSPHHYLLTVGALHRALGKAYTAEPCEAERARLREERDQHKAALDALRDAHHIPYVDEAHQGGNCADVVMSLLGRATRAERDLARVEASRRDWAAEAMGLAVQLERLEKVALDRNAIFSGILVGVGGEHDDPPSDEQNWRAVGLIERHIRREMGPEYVTQAEGKLLDAIENYGKVCVCISDDQAAALGPGFSRPVCAVHEQKDASDA